MATKSELSSDLVVLASRLLRQIRSNSEMPAGIRVLSLLDEIGPLSVTELATADNCAQPTMSAQVAGLVERGWVTKVASPDDARRSVITTSDAGRAALTETRRINGSLVSGRLGAHSAAELATAVAVLRAATTSD